MALVDAPAEALRADARRLPDDRSTWWHDARDYPAADTGDKRLSLTRVR
jgi:hypothetical protein